MKLKLLISELNKILRAFLLPFFLGKRKSFLKPNFVSLEIEDQCCLRCLQCDIWKQKRNPHRLTLSQIKKIILALKSWLGFYKLNLSGGENLMNPNTIPTIKFASQNGIFVHLNTNGFLVDKKMAKNLIKSGLGSLSFSLDSSDEKLHDQIRGKKGVYKKLTKAIDYLLEHRGKSPLVSLTTIILKQNLSQLPKLAEFVKQKGLDAIYLQALWHNLGAYHYDQFWYQKSHLWPNNFQKVNETILLLMGMKKKSYPIGNSLFELKEYKHYFENPLNYGKNRPCFVGINSFNVGIDGKVRLCFEMSPVGDILNESPEKIWNGKKAQKTREKIASCQRGCKVLLCNMALSRKGAFSLLFNATLNKIRKTIQESS